MNPTVSIVLPFRNAAATLSDALASIAGQTLTDWELLAIDDGSTDDSPNLVASAGASDSRIRLLSPGQIGLVAALNRGLEASRGEFIARMDADDWMRPRRLELQLQLLGSHPELGLASCLVTLFPDDALFAGYREYARWLNGCVTAEEIADAIYVESPLAHPSVMIRRALLIESGGYRDGDFPEDYELWLRLDAAGVRMAKVPQVLLDWREHPRRASRVDPRYARSAFDRIRIDYLSRDRRLARPDIVFWGAGRKTRLRSRLLIQRGIRPLAYIDIDPRKIGKSIDGIEVHPRDWLQRSDRPFVLAWVTNHGAREEIAAFLTAAGYRSGRDWLAVG